MSASNFMTMRDFPLYVRDFVYEDEDGTSYMDEDEATYIIQQVEEEMAAINKRLSFYQLSIQSGYYEGVQFYVKLENDPQDMDNDDCQCCFDMCRSRAIRRFRSEGNEVRLALAQLSEQYDFYEVVVVARFSNGETWYAPAAVPSQGTSRAAACSVS